MADAQLTLQPRTVIGKKVKQIRREGLVPGNVYGRGLESISVQAPLTEVRQVFRSVPRNSVVNVQIEGESATRPVVLRKVDRNPLTGEVRHVELYQVDLTRVIQSQALVVIVGASEAVHNGGTLVQALDTVGLEALPLDMPAEIEVSIGSLVNFGDVVHVGDIELPVNVRALLDASAQIVSVVAPRLEEVEEVVVEEGLEGVEGEEVEGEVAEGEEAAGGEGSSD
jgi:large subunit ribosomal protein L25